MPPPGRESLESGINNILMPHLSDKESYGLHVRMRTELFCYLLHNVAHLCLKYQMPRPYEDYLSDTAEVQVGTGFRHPENDQRAKLSVDAAHFCNTSFRANEVIVHVAKLGKSPHDVSTIWAFCSVLKVTSGATSFQLQHDNVGPDKIIDSFQTKYKNWFLRTVKSQQRVESGRDTYTRFVTELYKELSTSEANSVMRPTASGYAGAMAAKEILANIDLKNLSWSIEEEFVHIQRRIANLP